MCILLFYSTQHGFALKYSWKHSLSKQNFFEKEDNSGKVWWEKGTENSCCVIALLQFYFWMFCDF